MSTSAEAPRVVERIPRHHACMEHATYAPAKHIQTLRHATTCETSHWVERHQYSLKSDQSVRLHQSATIQLKPCKYICMDCTEMGAKVVMAIEASTPPVLSNGKKLSDAAGTWQTSSATGTRRPQLLKEQFGGPPIFAGYL